MASKKQKDATKAVTKGKAPARTKKALAEAAASGAAPLRPPKAVELEETLSPAAEEAEAPEAEAPEAEPSTALEVLPESSDDSAPAPSAPVVAPGMFGFAKARRLREAQKDAKRKEVQRAALIRKNEKKAQNHFEKVARSQAAAAVGAIEAEAFIKAHTPKGNPGRRLSRLDFAKRNSSSERQKQHKLMAKMHRMKQIQHGASRSGAQAAQAQAEAQAQEAAAVAAAATAEAAETATS